MGKKVFEIPSKRIADYCKRWKITELCQNKEAFFKDTQCQDAVIR
jgi:hypothetical protein